MSKATPLFFIGMCTFIANSLDDIEKDQINHPERPLPSGHIRPPIAATLYFICLAIALFATKLYIEAGIAFWYYFLLSASTSYGYVIDFLPGFKSLYVAGATSVPVLIVATYYLGEKRLYLVAGAVFAFVLGKELCMDLVDRPGDRESFMHRIRPGTLAITAYSLQAAGLLLLAIQAQGVYHAICLILISLLFLLSSLSWFKFARQKNAIFLMKAQLVVGLYFVV